MHHDWVLDVLSDLSDYARKNGLPGLAEHLDDTRHVANAEIARADAVQVLPPTLPVDDHGGRVRTGM
ncbi:MAG: hypothetical protein AAGB05_18470 [Pseudomonadota bacterium]